MAILSSSRQSQRARTLAPAGRYAQIRKTAAANSRGSTPATTIRSHKAELLADLADYSPEITYHRFTLAELEAEAADDWQEIHNDPVQLEAFAHALRTSETRQRGERPDHYTQAAECARCGPVWLWEGAPDYVVNCPWCLNNGPVPRPGLVRCGDCSLWKQDIIDPAGGLGSCTPGVSGLAWPWRESFCDRFQKPELDAEASNSRQSTSTRGAL